MSGGAIDAIVARADFSPALGRLRLYSHPGDAIDSLAGPAYNDKQ